MSGRFLVEYTGPIDEYFTTVNGQKVLFHQIKMKGQIDKVGEVYDQNSFNFILKDNHLTPYAPCPEALKQLNQLQKAREEAQAKADLAEQVRRLECQITAANVKIDAKQAQALGFVNAAKVLEEEIKDIEDLIPSIKDTIKDLLGVKKKPATKKGKK